MMNEIEREIRTLKETVARQDLAIKLISNMLFKEYGCFFTDCGGDYDIETCQKCTEYLTCSHGVVMDSIAKGLNTLTGGNGNG